jgi:hypothetical protein
MKNMENTKLSLIYIKHADGASFFKGYGWYVIDETLDIVGPWPSREAAYEGYKKLPRRVANV